MHKVEWPVQNVLAFTTTRNTPCHHSIIKPFVSNDPFNHFNLGLHVGDEPENVLAHRQNLLPLLPKNTQIQWLEQVHGSEVLLIEKHSKQALIADAAITREKHIALAIMTADCLPILLTAKDGREVAAIHGGWKPLAKGIIGNTLREMFTENKDINAWLGPCIGKESFEVGAEVRAIFTKQSAHLSEAFSLVSTAFESEHKNSEPKYLADLALIAKIQLTALGVNKIDHLEHCTYSDSAQYFSYRRENITGRMATIICRD
ncbi:MAG: peptidoglycan editing factor PgeF [Colwellia sp.]|nr:peptidoglycan editing factor PgeF [Colwellia sp.]